MEINLGNVQMAEPQRFSRQAINERVMEFTAHLRKAVEQDRIRSMDSRRLETIKLTMLPATARELLDGLTALMADLGAMR